MAPTTRWMDPSRTLLGRLRTCRAPLPRPRARRLPISCSLSFVAAHPSKLDLASAHSQGRFFDTTSFPNLSSVDLDPADFLLYPSFLSPAEHDVLLRCALRKLDTASTSSDSRRRRREWRRRHPDLAVDGGPDHFLPEEAYSFEDSHFDGVIAGYRETQVGDWTTAVASDEEASELASVLSRLYPLVVDRSSNELESGLQTPDRLLAHLLHLSSSGTIDPHVDNIDASGGVILGASLGGDRVMRLQRKPSSPAETESARLDVLLERGSVYVQRQAMRYTFEHSIPASTTFAGRRIGGTQRVSLMLRVRPSSRPRRPHVEPADQDRKAV